MRARGDIGEKFLLVKIPDYTRINITHVIVKYITFVSANTIITLGTHAPKGFNTVVVLCACLLPLELPHSTWFIR